jgi:hypothetical protein
MTYDESSSVASNLSKVSLHLNTQDEEVPAFALKPARRHRQFLPADNELEYECLKGYDHTLECPDNDSSCHSSPSEKVSSVKKRGGGSWLLGFVRESRPSGPIASLPDLVRSSSSSSLESSSTDGDDVSLSSSASSKKRGVSFNETVTALPIPHASTLTPLQRKKMYASSLEVRQNKIRNKKEYRYDGYDWRNCTEEWEMSVCMVTGDLVHPVHSI